ncbi:MAG: DevR family CRISPR-associated autoregulator [Candidatus Verstraetearchaeota archaeon]|nr:DevR family CRISPR-associated autoregulator [Candidatus Verstraetearchaeota archaeon]
MMQFALTVKLLMNMHDLNNERAEEIRRIPLIYSTKDGFKLVEEAVAVSGVMLKHWHAAYLSERAKSLGINLCPLCKRGEAIRLPPMDILTRHKEEGSAEVQEEEFKKELQKKSKKEEEVIEVIKEWLKAKEEKEIEKIKKYVKIIREGDEDAVIKECIGEDVHGFLRTRPPLRRESLIKFSWLLPIYIGDMPTPFRVVQHTRNIREIPKELPGEFKQMQMPYPRSYADGIFGFTSVANLDNVGVSFSNGKNVLDDEDKKKRVRALIEAFIPMLTGACGASLARALPAAKPLEVTVIVSKEAKISFPAPVHPIYEEYFDLNKGIFEGFSRVFNVDVTMYAYGTGKSERKDKFTIEIVGNPVEAFSKAIDYLNL